MIEAPVKRKPGRPRKNPEDHPSNWPETEALRQKYIAVKPIVVKLAVEAGFEDVMVDRLDAYRQIGLGARIGGKMRAVKADLEGLDPVYLVEKLREVVNVEPVAGEEAREGEREEPREGKDYGSSSNPSGGHCLGEVALPNAARLGAVELDCIHREAWEAFDMDAPRGKTDSIGRIWAFDPDIKGGVKRVSLSVRRVSGDRVEHLIECPAVGYQHIKPDVDACVDLLNEALA